ncbi:MAG TPA: hypothetical protein VGD45_15030 [Steroidobacter sp.]|uniref:hypothetical protein n=1 Tax=Steroidobacter sp. TaxID=1978227 RepID=UPI002ED7F4E2
MEAPRNFAVLIAALMLAIGVPMYIVSAQTHQGLPPERLPGEVWERGDGLGYNVSLNLGKDGKYIARWVGCLGEYGRSEGTWREVDGGIELDASREAGMMQGHLRRLERIVLGGEARLVPPEEVDEAKRFDVGEPLSNFYAFKIARLVEDASASDKTMEAAR